MPTRICGDRPKAHSRAWWNAAAGLGCSPPMRRAWETLGPVQAGGGGRHRPAARLPGGRGHPRQQCLLPAAPGRPCRRRSPCSPPAPGSSPWRPAPRIDRLDPAADMLANVDAHGQPVPTARFMGGREVELVAGADALQTPAGAGRCRGDRGGGRDGAAELRRRQRAVHGPAGPASSAIPGAAPARRAALARALRRADRRHDAGQARRDRPGDRRGQLSPQRRLLRSPGRPAPGPADPCHRRSQRYRARRLAARPLGRAAELAERTGGAGDTPGRWQGSPPIVRAGCI